MNPPRPTPALHLDLGRVRDAWTRLCAAMPEAEIHYAVKANPHPEVIEMLAGEGAGFDVAGAAETRMVRAHGVGPERIIHSHPIKPRDDLAECAALGITTFVADAPTEVRKIAATAPGSRLLLRLVTSGEGSDWPLSRKFGCSTGQALDLARLAHELGLVVAGTTFHVGSQQHDPDAWAAPTDSSARLFDQLRSEGMRPDTLDLGGGFPADLTPGLPTVEEFADHIRTHLAKSFPDGVPARLILEPGRGVVADAGVIVSRVIAVVERGAVRWVYLDVGVFGGLAETIDEAIRYPLTTSADGGPVGPCVLAGPTCDSVDVMYERHPVNLPVALQEGDLVRIHGAGAYTTCYASIGFNGIPPLTTEVHA